MNNDFIKGMEILIRCKHYVECRIETLQSTIEKMDGCGKDPQALQREVDRLQRLLRED